MAFVALLLKPACTFKNLCKTDNTGGTTTGGAGTPSTHQGGDSGTHSGSAGKGGLGGSGGSSGGTTGGSISEGGEGGAGGAGGAAAACAACVSGVCRGDGSCIIDCSPAGDACPNGQYCADDNTCATGCDAANRCASGSCVENHNCKHCISASECSPGYVCSAGECAPPCSAAQEGQSAGCRGDLSCCALRCSDLKADLRNCGACGNACSEGQFCGLTECHDTTLANICAVGKITTILDTTKDTTGADNLSGRAIGAALGAQCKPKPLLEEAEQESAEALNVATGRPVSDGSELLVVVGGPSSQNVEANLESRRVAPLFRKTSGMYDEYRNSATDEVVVSQLTLGDHESQDLFVIQFIRDPESGSLVLNAQGFSPSGTAAAAYQFTNAVLPNPSQYRKAWYVYQWTDADGDKAPDLNEIAPLASGD